MSISRINNNVAALNANFNLSRTSRQLEKSIERLSSGLRINRAGDDAAGMTVATRIRSQVRGLNRAVMNAQDGINMINVAEGAMEEMTSRLDRIRVLAVQAGNTGVNDLLARQALQDEVFQSIDEISRIADTTQFSKNRLLNGDFAVDAQVKPGQDGPQNFGIRIDGGPASNTLENGVHFLNIVKTSNGFQQIVGGLDDNGITSTINAGVQNATDFAVSLAYFTEGNAGLTNGTGLNATNDTIVAGFFNGVSISRDAVVSFEGVLSDGTTKFFGAISAVHVGTDITFQGFTSAIGEAIADAESSIFGGSANVPNAFKTTAAAQTSGANAGRILLRSNGESVNLSDLTVRVTRSGEIVSKSEGVTRSGEIGAASVLGGQGQIGNAVTAITGSTFGTGDFVVSVEDVQGAQNRRLESTIAFRDKNGNIINRNTSLTHTNAGLSLNGSFVDGVYTGGVSVTTGDTISLRGIEADGTTFTATYTFSNTGTTDSNLSDFTFASVSGLLSELNFRTRYYGSGNALNGDLTRFESAIFTFSPAGVLQLIDDIGRDNSQLDFTLTFNDSNASTTPAYTISDDAELTQEGFTESATFRLNGGDAFRASAGEMVTAFGEEPTREGEVQPQLTFRVGTGLTVGTDTIIVEGQEFVGRLNGGPAVTFQNGAQDVVFIDDGSFNTGTAKVLQVDFDGILDITSSSSTIPDPGTTILLSVVNNAVNFQIGAFAEQRFRTAIGDLTSQNLGFGKGSGRTIEDIDIRTVEGVDEALRIVDEALDQINRTRSLLGAATNRLEGTIASLSVASENLTAAESRLRDADIALESSEFAQNQVLLQAGVSVLAQANFLPQSFLSLLG